MLAVGDVRNVAIVAGVSIRPTVYRLRRKNEQSSNSDDWLQAELADTLDEDFELELSEPPLSEEIRKIYKSSHPPTIERAEYFQHLLTLQAELIKLQDWVQHTKAK